VLHFYCWDCGFESGLGHGYSSLLGVVLSGRCLRPADRSSRGFLLDVFVFIQLCVI